MKKAIALLTCLTLSLSLASCGGSGDGGENESGFTTATLQMSTTVGDNSTAAKMCNLFAEKVSEATDGAVTINVFTSDQLSGGDMAKGVDMLVAGGTSCAFEPVDVLSSLDERVLSLNLAWTFDSYEQAEEMLNGTQSPEEAVASITEQVNDSIETYNLING